MTVEISEADLLDTLTQAESRWPYGGLIRGAQRADMVDNEFSAHEFQYELCRIRAKEFPELLRDFADELEDFLARYGHKGDNRARLAHILADGASEHINALLERLEYKEAVVAFHGEKLVEAARLAISEVARLQAGGVESQAQVEYLDPHGCYVYILWGDEGPVYVGKTTNILNRPGDHMRDPERRAATNRVQFLRYPNKGEMTAAELALIQRYRPRFNVAGNPDVPR